MLFIALQSATRPILVLLVAFSDLGYIELCRTGTGGSHMGGEPGIGTKGALILSAHRWAEFIVSAGDTLTFFNGDFSALCY